MSLSRVSQGGSEGQGREERKEGKCEILQGWLDYKRRYRERASWLFQHLEEIKEHELCINQFPEATCNYVSAGLLTEGLEEGKQWYVAMEGEYLPTEAPHIWLFDQDARVFIDTTAHQFPAIRKRLEDECAHTGLPPIIVLPPGQYQKLGFKVIGRANEQHEQLQQARSEYLEGREKLEQRRFENQNVRNALKDLIIKHTNPSGGPSLAP